MVHCPNCYEQSPVCEKGANPQSVCTANIPDATANRLSEGYFTTNLTNAFPREAQNADGLAIQALTFTAAATAAFVAGSAEALLMATPSTLTIMTIFVMVTVIQKHYDQVAIFKPLCTALMGSANLTQAQVALIKVGLDEITKVEDAQRRDVQTGRVKTPAEFAQKTYPRTSILNTIIRGTEKGVIVDSTTVELFDSATGRKYVPFAKQTKVTSEGNLMYSLHIFTIVMCGLLKEATKVYDRFMRDICQVMASRGFMFAQEYVVELLKLIDEGICANMVSLYTFGEHNRIMGLLGDARDNRPITIPPGFDPNKDFKGNGDPRGRIKFGPVTQPVGGAGAGAITDWKTKAKKKCDRFHSTPKGACTAGIPAGDPRFTTCQVGLCAYEH